MSWFIRNRKGEWFDLKRYKNFIMGNSTTNYQGRYLGGMGGRSLPKYTIYASKCHDFDLIDLEIPTSPNNYRKFDCFDNKEDAEQKYNEICNKLQKLKNLGM